MSTQITTAPLRNNVRDAQLEELALDEPAEIPVAMMVPDISGTLNLRHPAACHPGCRRSPGSLSAKP